MRPEPYEDWGVDMTRGQRALDRPVPRITDTVSDEGRCASWYTVFSATVTAVVSLFSANLLRIGR